MLVLTRKLGEDIRIGDDVLIRVLEVRGSQVKLGIEAPPAVKVHRGEIYARIQEENRRAAAVNKPTEAQDPGNAGQSSARDDPSDRPPPSTSSRGVHRLALVIGGYPATAHS